MRALKYTFTAFFVYSLCLYGNDIDDREFSRSPHARYEVNDIFGAAKLIKHILEHSDQLKHLLKDPLDLLQATFVVGSIAALVRMSLLGVQGLSARIPDWTAKIAKWLFSRCMRLFGLPEGFDGDQLLMWTQMFEQIMIVWCDKATFGPEREYCLLHWDYQRNFIKETLSYLISFLQVHEEYYRNKQLSRGKLMTTYIGDNHIDHVCFLVRSTISSLQHLIVVSEHTEQPSAFNLEHVQKVACNVVIMMKKLCTIIGGESMQSMKQADYNFGGQAFMPTSNLFDV